MPTQPTLDPSVLGEFAAMLGDDGASVVAELIATYLEDAPQRVANVDEAITSRDLETLRRAAHTLKSSSASVGAMQLSQLSASIERATYDDPDTAFSVADAGGLRAELERVQTKLAQLGAHQSSDQGDVGAHRVIA